MKLTNINEIGPGRFPLVPCRLPCLPVVLVVGEVLLMLPLEESLWPPYPWPGRHSCHDPAIRFAETRRGLYKLPHLSCCGPAEHDLSYLLLQEPSLSLQQQQQSVG